MDTFLIKAVQLILAFAILVIIHEFGHFFFARIFGVKVEKFYIFFDPWKEIFKWKPGKYFGFFGGTRQIKEKPESAVKKKSRISKFWGDTEYGIGWLPLGGYCKISGMIDESMDKEQMAQPPKDWEFRSKPAWQRLLIMVAGVLFNFLLAIIIYAGLVYATGEKYVPFKEAKMGMIYSGEAQKIGFRNGDIPLMADGKELERPGDALMEMIQAKSVTVLRDKDTVSISIPDNFMLRLDEEAKSDTASVLFMAYRFPARVSQVVTGEPAAKAGIQKGDEFIKVNDIYVPSLPDFQRALKGHENEKIEVTLLRHNQSVADTVVVPVTLTSNSKMGIGLETNPAEFFNSKEIKYNMLQAIPRGFEMGKDKLTTYAKSMSHVFSKEGAESIGGFGSIGSIFPEKWDWIAFWNIAAFLSVALAFMNILPIPALDGGHVMFLLYEVIFRRKPSEKFMEWAQMIGMGLLLLLLVYANGMDIVRLFK